MPNSKQAFFGGADALQIKQAMLVRRMTVSALARKIRRSRVATSRAIHHPERLPKLRAKIEEALGEN
jgi:hypothetical protein